MEDRKYSIRYLPLFEQDLENAVDYIQYQLNNPTAAERFIDEVESAIQKRSEYPESFETYLSVKERKHNYYRIYVKKYVVYYVVIDDVMEVRRLIYSRRDMKSQI